jgi:hypothetical protein
MKFKRQACTILILFAFVFCGGPLDVLASEAGIIKLLIKKGIITQQEADELMKEATITETKEKAEIKKEVKAEIQEDIRKDAAKGEFLPPTLKGFKFGTTIYADWDSISRSSGPNKNTNQFSLTRAYVTLTKDFNDWLGMNITSDLFTPRDPNDVNNGLQLRIKFAFLDLKLFGTETMLGMIPTPSDYYDSAIWPYRVQGNNLLDGLGIQATADMGVVNMGTFGGYMDDEYLKYAAKPFAGKWGGYMVGAYNGSGFDMPENNQNKGVSGLVYVRPFPMISILKGFQLAYVGTYGESNSNFAAAGRTTDYPAWQVNIIQASLQHSYFTIMGQYYWGMGTRSSNEQDDRKAYELAAFMRIPGVEKLRAFGKWYYYDPNTHRSSDGHTVYVAGMSYDVTKEFMPFVAWERQNTSVNSAATGNLPAVDYTKYQVGFQFKY